MTTNTPITITYTADNGWQWEVTYRSALHWGQWEEELAQVREDWFGHLDRLQALAWRDMACPPEARDAEGQPLPAHSGQPDRMVPTALALGGWIGGRWRLAC